MKHLTKMFLLLLVAPLLLVVFILLVPALLLLMFLFAVFTRRRWTNGYTWHASHTTAAHRPHHADNAPDGDIIDVDATSVTRSVSALETSQDPAHEADDHASN